MKKFLLPIFALLLCISMSGCGLMEDAFKAGLVFGLIIIAIIGLIIWLVRIVVIEIGKRYELEIR